MTALFDLTGRNAVVTGGSAGIGLAMARALAEAGARVSIWGRTASRLEAARDQLVADGLDVVARTVDVSDEQAVVDGMEAAASHGSLDAVVVNAGVGGTPVPFVRSTTDEYRRVLATNLDGAYWTLREAGRLMVDQARAGGRGGSIIAISSLAAVEGAGHNQAYGATKGGLLALANGAAVELARHGVRVNTVLPGWIDTDMAGEALASPGFAKAVLPRVPVRRWGRPEDLAGIAVYLASDAAAYQTGSQVVVDGGYSIF
jgi:NAD(P)-dependent dehydrogenase (short-subunit alcohol dehydrogenase family)